MAFNLSFLLILSGLTGICGIITVSRVSVKAGDSISIPCLYGSQYRNQVKYLCKGFFWYHCSYAVKTNQPSSGKFSISDDKDQRIFTVTIEDLTNQDADYICAVEIDRGADIRAYFQLSVTKDTPSLYVDHQQISAFKGDDLTINCYHHISGETKWCRLGSSCVTESSGFIDGTEVTINENLSVFTVTMSGLKTKSSGWYWCVKGGLQMPVHVTVLEQPTTNTHTATKHLTTFLTSSENVNHTSVFASKNTTAKGGNLSSFSFLSSLTTRLSLLVFFVMVTSFIWFTVKRHKQTKESSATTMQQEEVRDVRQTSSVVPSRE